MAFLPASKVSLAGVISTARTDSTSRSSAMEVGYAKLRGMKLCLWWRADFQSKAATGPDSLAFISSSKCTNEESYLMQKLARAVVGTNNMDNCSRYCQAPATMGLFRTVGYGGDSGSITDIEKAGLVLIVGSNTAESHPVLATRVKRAHKMRGQKLIVADLRENEMAERADVFFRPRPGTDLIWLSAVTKYILDNGLANQAFIDKWVNKADEFKKSLESYTRSEERRV